MSNDYLGDVFDSKFVVSSLRFELLFFLSLSLSLSLDLDDDFRCFLLSGLSDLWFFLDFFRFFDLDSLRDDLRSLLDFPDLFLFLLDPSESDPESLVADSESESESDPDPEESEDSDETDRLFFLLFFLLLLLLFL